MNVVLVGALDTKHAEYGFVRDRITAAGVPCLVVDTSVLGTPGIAADVDRRAVAQAAGADHEALADAGDRNAAVAAMARGAAAVVRDLHRAGRVAAVVVLGGSNAGFVMSEVAPVLPLGVPKVLVSTVVAGDTRPYVGTSDVTMIYPVVDVAGLNSVSTPVLAKAADAVVGMVTGPPVPARADRPVVGATMFGVTTACVQAVSEHLAANGAEVQVFHCTGTGGRTFESLIASGLFAAVADITTTELADELVGGVCTAGPHRLEAAAAHGVPQVVSVGALDMVNFGPRDTVPAEHTGRHLIAHNPSVTLMRTTPAECEEIGRRIAAQLNKAQGPVVLVLPLRGVSMIDAEGQPFHDREADRVLFDTLRGHVGPNVRVVEVDAHINDPEFAQVLVDELLRIMPQREN